MAAEPFVQFVFNFLTKKILDGTEATAPQTWQVTSDAAGKVVIRDYKGIVLGIGKWNLNATVDRVRSRAADKLDDKRWEAIDQKLQRKIEQARQRGPGDPNKLDPAVIDPADIAQEMPKLDPAFKQMQDAPVGKPGRKGKSRGADVFAGADHDMVDDLVNNDPTAGADHGAVNSVIKGRGNRRRKSAARNALEWGLVVVILAAIVVGVVMCSRTKKHYPVGAECTFDNDCQSHNCRRSVCRP